MLIVHVPKLKICLKKKKKLEKTYQSSDSHEMTEVNSVWFTTNYKINFYWYKSSTEKQSFREVRREHLGLMPPIWVHSPQESERKVFPQPFKAGEWKILSEQLKQHYTSHVHTEQELNQFWRALSYCKINSLGVVTVQNRGKEKADL